MSLRSPASQSPLPANSPAEHLLLAFSPKPPSPPRKPSLISRCLSATAFLIAAPFRAYSRRAATRRIAWEDARENWILKQQRETIETIKSSHARQVEDLQQQLTLCQEALQFQTDANQLNREVIAWYVATFGRKIEQENAVKAVARGAMTQRGDGLEGLFQ